MTTILWFCGSCLSVVVLTTSQVRFHFAVRLYSTDDTQMTSKRGENKEVRYEPAADEWRDLCSYHVLTSSVNYQSTDPRQNEIYLFLDLVNKTNSDEIMNTMLSFDFLAVCFLDLRIYYQSGFTMPDLKV